MTGRGRRRSVVLLAAASLLAAGARALTGLLASKVVTVRRIPPYPGRLLAVGAGEVVLARDEGTELPGTYGLGWPGGHAVLGEVLQLDDSTVRRRLVAVQSGELAPGQCRIDHIEIGDPASALGLDFFGVELQGDLGPMPAWLVPGKRTDAWVLLAHGYGGSLESSLSFLPALNALGCTCLVVSYRNDPGAPPSADDRYHLGASEWRDLHAGLAYAAQNGARRVALYGWSMGGAVVLQTLASSDRRDLVTAVVLDCPVLDWSRVVSAIAQARRVPRPLTRSVLRAVERRIAARLSDLDWLARAGELDRPILCIHGEQDRLVSCAASVELAERRPDLVELVLDPLAGHVGSFNVDPDRYAGHLGAFLDRHLLAEPRQAGAGVE